MNKRKSMNSNNKKATKAFPNANHGQAGKAHFRAALPIVNWTV
ncbi:hypothetical protein [Stenotrophomonas sp. Y-13]